MYRIELAPGEETVFRTIEELAVGVRNGLVTSRSRIYHGASQKWLPIEFHPHYKKALELSAHRQDLPAAPVPERLDTLSFAVSRPPAEPPRQPTPAAAPAPAAPSSVAKITALPPAPDPVPLAEPAPEPAVFKPFVTPTIDVAPARAKPVEHRHTSSRPGAIEPVVVQSIVPRPVVATPAESTSVVRTRVEFPALAALADSEPAERIAIPAAVASPVSQFPAIVYPEITPAEQPVVEPVTEAARSRRPLHVAGAIVVLALGGYGMLSFAPSRSVASVPEVADRPVLAQPEPAPQATPAAEAPPPPPAGPKPVTMTQPASSGFAPALESRAIVAPAATSAATTPVAAPVKDSSLAPAPIDVVLEVPVIAGADSLMAVPSGKADSAMKRILRAVNGGKDLPQSR